MISISENVKLIIFVLELKVKKVLITGIENVGKTAIINIIREKDLKYTLNLTPTRGICRQIIKLNNIKLCIWDLGGVLNYRKKYYEKSDLFFSFLDEIVFVVDFQDLSNFKDSFIYLKKIAKILKRKDVYRTLGANFNFTILLHKFDPGLNEYQASHNKLKFFKKSIGLIDIPFDYEIIATSIYNFKKNFLHILFNNGVTIEISSLIKKLLTTIPN